MGTFHIVHVGKKHHRKGLTKRSWSTDAMRQWKGWEQCLYSKGSLVTQLIPVLLEWPQ